MQLIKGLFHSPAGPNSTFVNSTSRLPLTTRQSRLWCQHLPLPTTNSADRRIVCSTSVQSLSSDSAFVFDTIDLSPSKPTSGNSGNSGVPQVLHKGNQGRVLDKVQFKLGPFHHL